MRVLIVSPCILPVPAVNGGAVLTLIESLISQNEIYHNMDLTVVGSFNHEAVKESEKYTSVKFIFLKGLNVCSKVDAIVDTCIGMVKRNKKVNHYLWKLLVIEKVSCILKSDNYDKVVFQNSGFLLNVLKSKKIAYKYKDKFYYHLHNDISDNISIKCLKQIKLLLVSEYLSKKINQLYGNFIYKYSIVKNGIEVERFLQKLEESERIQLITELGIPKKNKIIIFAGRIVPEKGICELTEALCLLNRSDVTLLVLGSNNFGTSQTTEFEKNMKIKFSSLNDKVVFTGYIPFKDMWKYYQLGNVAVLPSMWEEPAGLTMIEAAASRVPVITTKSGGILEYLNKDSAIFLERDNHIVNYLVEAMNEVIDNEEKWNLIAEKASKYVQEHFSEEQFYKAFMHALM